MISFSNPVFVSGHTRSGTNLLMRLIDGAPGILVPPGEGKLNILRRFFLRNYPMEGDPAAMAEAVTRDIELNLDDAGEARFRALVEEEVRGSPGPKGFVDTVVLILSAIARYNGLDGRPTGAGQPIRWMEKNHNLEFFWNRARFLFGRPKLLFVLRNPLDNWLSWREYMAANGLDSSMATFGRIMREHYVDEVVDASFGPGAEPVDLAARYGMRWRAAEASPPPGDRGPRLRAGEADLEFDPTSMNGADTAEGRFAWNYRRMYEKALALREATPEDVRVVRYEDMVLDTDRTMREVLEFLGSRMGEVNRQPTDHGQSWGGNSSFRSAAEGIYRGGVGRGAERLDADEIARVAEVLRGVPGVDVEGTARIS